MKKQNASHYSTSKQVLNEFFNNSSDDDQEQDDLEPSEQNNNHSSYISSQKHVSSKSIHRQLSPSKFHPLMMAEKTDTKTDKRNSCAPQEQLPEQIWSGNSSIISSQLPVPESSLSITTPCENPAQPIGNSQTVSGNFKSSNKKENLPIAEESNNKSTMNIPKKQPQSLSEQRLYNFHKKNQNDEESKLFKAAANRLILRRQEILRKEFCVNYMALIALGVYLFIKYFIFNHPNTFNSAEVIFCASFIILMGIISLTIILVLSKDNNKNTSEDVLEKVQKSKKQSKQPPQQTEEGHSPFMPKSTHLIQIQQQQLDHGFDSWIKQKQREQTESRISDLTCMKVLIISGSLCYIVLIEIVRIIADVRQVFLLFFIYEQLIIVYKLAAANFRRNYGILLLGTLLAWALIRSQLFFHLNEDKNSTFCSDNEVEIESIIIQIILSASLFCQHFPMRMHILAPFIASSIQFEKLKNQPDKKLLHSSLKSLIQEDIFRGNNIKAEEMNHNNTFHHSQTLPQQQQAQGESGGTNTSPDFEKDKSNHIKKMYQDILNVMPEGVALISSSGKLVYANKTLSKIFDCQKSQIMSILLNLATKPKQEGEINPVSPVFQAKKGLITQAKSLKTITAGSPKGSSQLSELPSPLETGKHKTSLMMKPSLFNRNRKLSSSEELMLTLQAQNYIATNAGQNQTQNSKDTKRFSGQIGLSKTVPCDFTSNNTPLADDQTEEKAIGINQGQFQNFLNSSRQVSTPQQQPQLSQSQQFQSASTPQANQNNNNNGNMFYSRKTNDYSDVLSVTNYMHVYPQNGNNNNNSINNGILNIFNNNNNNAINLNTFAQQKDLNAEDNSINYQFLEHAKTTSIPNNQDGNEHFVRKQRSKKFKNTEILKKDLNIKDILASIFDNLKQTQQDQDTKTAKTFKLKKLNSDVTSHQTNTQPNKNPFARQTSFFSQMKGQQNIGYFQYIDDKVKVEVEYKNTTLVLSMVMCEIVANGFVEQLALVLIDPLWQEMYERKLQDMSNYRMKMFASLSHELRTPLNCSISMLQQLKNSIKEEAEHHLKQKSHQKNPNMSIKDKIKQRLSVKKDENSNKSSVFNSQIESVNQKIIESNITNNINKNTPELNPKRSSIVAASQNVEISHKHAHTLEKVNEWTQEYIDPALNSNNLLLNLINDILDFVQIDSGKFKFSFIKFDLEQLLTNCVSMVGIQSKNSTGKVQLELKFDERCPKIINSDPNRIRQIILNFLSNALKFTAQGCITVSVTLLNQKDNKPLPPDTSSQSDSPLKIDLLSCIDDDIANNPNDVIEIAVEDQGIGISQEDINKIFTIFNKIELGNNQSLNSQGCGLGLTISNSIAKGLGPFNQGGIRVQSEIGHGSIFSILVEDREEGLQEHKFSQKEELVKKMATINSLVDSPISQYNKQLQHQVSSFHALDAQLQKQQSSLHQQQGKMVRLNSNFTNKTNRTNKTVKTSRTRTKSKSIKAEDSCCVCDSEVNKNTAQHFTPMAAFQINDENEMEFYNDMSSLGHSQMQMSMHHKTSIYNNNNKDIEGSEVEVRSHFRGNDDSNRNIMSNNNIEGNRGGQQLQQSEADENPEDTSEATNTYVHQNYNKAPLYKTATLKSKTCYRTKTLETIKTEQKDIADAFASYDGIRTSKRNPQKINSSSNPSISKFGMPSIDSDLAAATPMLASSKNINKISKRSLLSSQNPLTDRALKSPKQDNNNNNSKIDEKEDGNNNNNSNDKSEDLSAKYILKDGIYRGNPRQSQRQAKKKCDCAQILVVDDNMFNMHALSLQLKTYGFLIEQACNGQVAVDTVVKRFNENTCCRTHKLIFMDIEMPIKNGYEATEDIRKFFNGSSFTDKQPIIVACTAYVSDEDKNKALSHGMDDFIKKPVFQEGLDQLLSQWYDVIFEEDTSEFSDSEDEDQGESGEKINENYDEEQSKLRKQSATQN